MTSASVARILGLTVSKESFGLIAVCLVDTLLTVVLIAMGLAREANPLMARCLVYGFIPFCLVKLGTVLIAVTVAEVHRRRNPVFVKKLLQMGITGYLGLYFVLVLVVNTA